MEKRILAVGVLITVLGAGLFLLGSTTPGALMMTLGALDLVAVIFWPKLTGAISDRKEYSLGNQVVDALMIASGVALTVITGMPVFLALIAGGVASLSYRHQKEPALA
ncbi:hypothetical protein CPHO_00880 [Corynebacterium phocae]|uniref:Uncharacterized protein n=1 Tax=Corynebacterium phocae TaxID=161895 RepID=A0A1L7D0V3_9CORY|nr:hypothetical protein [Corynebacterium phocae]APT91717.1 hypothetical protein CPHO_00880 [Corynebacterium phocae]KAA8728574.1 hypothetical protein F4V58_00420 [Corynebacterium phocae]